MLVFIVRTEDHGSYYIVNEHGQPVSAILFARFYEAEDYCTGMGYVIGAIEED